MASLMDLCDEMVTEIIITYDKIGWAAKNSATGLTGVWILKLADVLSSSSANESSRVLRLISPHLIYYYNF